MQTFNPKGGNKLTFLSLIRTPLQGCDALDCGIDNNNYTNCFDCTFKQFCHSVSYRSLITLKIICVGKCKLAFKQCGYPNFERVLRELYLVL